MQSDTQGTTWFRALHLATAFALCSAAGARADEPRIGTFVPYERPIYLEIDRLVAGQPCHVEVRNVPEGSQRPVLFFSPTFRPVDMSFANVPGVMGPDLVEGAFQILPSASYDTVVKGDLAGKRLYLQAFVVTKKGKRLSNMVEVEVRKSNYDLGGDDDRFELPIDLITQEVLPSGQASYDRDGQPVRVGVPLPRGQVWETRGVPELAVQGPTPAGQVSTLSRWPDGSVKWALVEYLADVDAGVWNHSYSVVRGNGNFGGANLCSVSGSVLTVDTGTVKFVIDGNAANLFQSFTMNGQAVLDTAVPNRFRFLDSEGVSWTYHPTSAVVRVNGPVRCEIQVDGMFTRSTSANDEDRVYLRTHVEAYRNNASVRLRTSLRNSSVHFPYDLQFRGLSFDLRMKEAGPYDVRLAKPSQNGSSWGSYSGSLVNPEDLAVLEMGFVENKDYELTDEHESSSYTPFVQRASGSGNYVKEGVCARINDTFLTGDYSSNYFTSRNEYCNPYFLQLDGKTSGRGMVVSVPQAAATWPLRLFANQKGDVQVQLFPVKDWSDEYHYPLTYATCETRTFVITPELVRTNEPAKLAASVDYPLGARAALSVYNQSKVWPWHLVSTTDSRTFASHAGLPEPWIKYMDPTRTIYRFAGGTGGENNNWRSSQAFYQFLRTGYGGAWFRAQGEALYKADKMAVTLDDASLDEYQTPLNEGTATKHGKFWDGSKHTYLQSVPDVGFAFGDLMVLDSAPHFAETITHVEFTSSQPFGNFVPGTFGAVSSSAAAMLQIAPNQALYDNTYRLLYQWSNAVFQEKNDFGVDTATKGWQAAVGTPPNTAADPDGYFVTKGSGKSSDWAEIGYQYQVWVDSRLTALSYSLFVHHLREVAPNDPLLEDLSWRARDLYHFSRRSAPDDHSASTGDEYVHDVFPGDGGNPDVDKYLGPGNPPSKISQTGYALQGWINFYLDQVESESAYSYGVELARSMSENTYVAKQDDPVFNEFVYRYLRHYGLIDP